MMTMRLGLRSREPLPKRKASIDVPIAICRFCKQVLSDGEPGPSGVYEGCCPTCGEIQHKRQQQARAQMERAIEKREEGGEAEGREGWSVGGGRRSDGGQADGRNPARDGCGGLPGLCRSRHGDAGSGASKEARC